MRAALETNKHRQNAFLRAADACRQMAIAKDINAVDRYNKTRHR